MLDDFNLLDYPGHELSAISERWCYDCNEYANLDTLPDHEAHDLNTTVERYCFDCREMHIPEQLDIWPGGAPATN